MVLSAHDQRAAQEQKNVWDIIYGQVGESPASNRVAVIVPYLQGVYGPYWDQHARAVFFGLQTDHGDPRYTRTPRGRGVKKPAVKWK